MSDYDVVVIGAGPTGLIASQLLAKEGKKVALLELNDRVGGMGGNVEVFPGYKHNAGAYYIMFADAQKLIKTIGIEDYGMEFLKPPISGVGFAGPGRAPWVLYTDPEEAGNYLVNTFGMDAAMAYGAYNQFISPFVTAMKMALKQPPISIGRIMDTLPSIEAKDACRQIFFGSLTELVDQYFPDKEKYATIRGQLIMMGTDAFYGSPSSAGSAMTLAYHAATSSEAVEAPAVIPKGGIGALADTIAQAFQDNGGTIMLNTEVTRIIIEEGTAKGVELSDGTVITADTIVSSLDTRNTFINCMDEADVDPAFATRVKHINYDNDVCQWYVCLNKLPSFAPEYDYLNDGKACFQVSLVNPDLYEENWNKIRFKGEVPERLVGAWYYIPSMVDPSLAPEGKHVLTGGSSYSWPLNTPEEKVPEVKEKLIRAFIDSFKDVMPDFEECIDAIEVMTPYDYENKYHVSGGSWTHGSTRQDQLLNMRPMLGMSDYRTPYRNLYLCGTSNHPGPGISGISSVNCVKAIKEDWNKR